MISELQIKNEKYRNQYPILNQNVYVEETALTFWGKNLDIIPGLQRMSLPFFVLIILLVLMFVIVLFLKNNLLSNVKKSYNKLAK